MRYSGVFASVLVASVLLIATITLVIPVLLKPRATQSTSSEGPFSITRPDDGGPASVYGFGAGWLEVSGSTDLKPANWVYEPTHSEYLITPSGTQCLTNRTQQANYLNILSGTVVDRSSVIVPTYLLKTLGVWMYMSDLSRLQNPQSIAKASSLGWFFHFDFGNRSFYAGILMVEDSSLPASLSLNKVPIPGGISYWYGPWKDGRPTGGKQTNGSVDFQAPGFIGIDVPAEAVGNITRGDTLTNMGILTATWSGTGPDTGFYCINDSTGGGVSFRLFDGLLSNGSIQVTATPLCPEAASTAPSNWTTAQISNQNYPDEWGANVYVAGAGEFVINAREVQNGTVSMGPITIIVSVNYWIYATTSEGYHFPSACPTG